ncbi:MAG: CNP1-like family protein [Burkholderiales bacterium]
MFKTAPEVPWMEDEVKELPAFPEPSSLVPFIVQRSSKYGYRADPRSLSAGKDGIVRFVLAIDASGAGQQVSYAGIHCETKRWKTYAIGTSANGWRRLSKPAWEAIEKKSLENYREELYSTYFCSGGAPAGDEKVLLANLSKDPGKRTRR